MVAAPMDRTTYAMRHALGLDNPSAKGKSYRNRYITADHGLQFDIWSTLVREGKAERVPSDKLDAENGHVCFVLTRAAAESVLRPGESLDPEDF